MSGKILPWLYKKLMRKVSVTYSNKIYKIDQADPNKFIIAVRLEPVLDLTELTKSEREIIMQAIHEGNPVWL